MTFKYLVFFLILLIVVVLFISTLLNNIEGARPRTIIENRQVSTKQTDIDPTTGNVPINTAVHLWTNIGEMRNIARQYKYIVSDWSSHLNLIINKIGCNFSILDKTTNTWIRVEMQYRVPTINKVCKRIFKRTICSSSVSYVMRTNTQRRMNVSNARFYKIDIQDYRVLMEQIANEYNIRNDAELRKAIRFSASEGFETIEGFNENQIKNATTLDKYNRKPVAFQKAIDNINQNDYTVSERQFAGMLKQYASSGKTNSDFKNYITAMKQFGLNREEDANVLKQFIKSRLTQNNKQPVNIEVLITTYFPSYGITNVSDIVDVTNRTPGPFTNTIQRLGLMKQNIFPTNANKDNCIMEKLKRINGITIRTVGKNSQNHYYMNDFFDAFNSYNVRPMKFFRKIYQKYVDLSIQMSIKPIDETLYYIQTFGPDMETAFNNMQKILGELSMQSLNEYITYVDVIKVRFVNTSRPNATVLVKIWKDFVRYYREVAYGKDVKLDDPVTVTTLSRVLTEIEDWYSSNKPPEITSSTYFNVTIDEFQSFFEILYTKKYNIEALKRDIRFGSTCKRFLTSTNKESFTSSMKHKTEETEDTVFTKIQHFIENLFGVFFTDKEGAQTISDSTLLSSFGINEFTEELGQLETKLLQLDINSLNRNVDTQTNMMRFIQIMVKNGIVYRDMDGLIEILNQFEVKNVVEWIDVLKYLSKINISGVENIKAFLSKIVKFGVVKGDKFKLFLEYIYRFGADFSSVTINAFNNFIDDMIRFGFTYHTPVKINVTNTVITYLVTSGIRINTYTTRPLQIPNCNPLNVDNFPSIFLNDLYNYSKISGTPYPNNMYDVQNPDFIVSIPSCDIIEMMQQAHMLINRLDKYNNYNAILHPNIINIISFFYKEEVDEIKQESQFYSSFENRVNMMNGVSSAIIRYADTIKLRDQIAYKLYNNIGVFLTIFPALSFQYFSSEIRSTCMNGKCRFDDYVNPNNTTCKASTKDPTVNYRLDPPVIPR